MSSISAVILAVVLVLPRMVLADTVIEHVAAKLRQVPRADEYVSGGNFAQTLGATPTSGQMEKAQLLARSCHSEINATLLNPRSLFVKAVQLIDALRAAPKIPHGSESLVVHGDNLLPFTVQVYRNGHAYIHMQRHDPKGKKGGYKTFSRSIDYDSGKVFANLTQPVRDDAHIAGVERELGIMEEFRSSRDVLTFRDADAFVPAKGADRFALIMQTELYDGDLNSRDLTNLPVFLRVARASAQALLHFHERGFAHRDLKPGNFFIRGVGERTEIVLADFGFGESPREKKFGHCLAGTRGYMAPETCSTMLNSHHAYSNLKEAQAADIFSLGITLFAILEQETDNSVKTATSVVNTIAMPRNATAPEAYSVEALTQAIAELRKAHTEAFGHAKFLANKAEKVKYLVNTLIWEMTQPDPSKRIALKDVVPTLEQIERFAK